MYEAAAVDDIYEAYDCLAIGEGEVGVACARLA
jgi:hypothetical protein